MRGRAWGSVAVFGRNSGDGEDSGAVGPLPGGAPPVRDGPRARPRGLGRWVLEVPDVGSRRAGMLPEERSGSM